jgi:hypothetical protein
MKCHKILRQKGLKVAKALSTGDKAETPECLCGQEVVNNLLRSTEEFRMSINQYLPGRFAHYSDKPFFNELWQFLTDPKNVSKMVDSTMKGKPAIEALLPSIESRFEEYLTSTEYPKEEIGVLVNNMIKQFFEFNDYKHIGCGKCCHGRFIKNSGIFRKSDNTE